MKRRRLSKLRYGRMEERRMLAFVDPGFSRLDGFQVDETISITEDGGQLSYRLTSGDTWALTPNGRPLGIDITGIGTDTITVDQSDSSFTQVVGDNSAPTVDVVFASDISLLPSHFFGIENVTQLPGTAVTIDGDIRAEIIRLPEASNRVAGASIEADFVDIRSADRISFDFIDIENGIIASDTDVLFTTPGRGNASFFSSGGFAVSGQLTIESGGSIGINSGAFWVGGSGGRINLIANDDILIDSFNSYIPDLNSGISNLARLNFQAGGDVDISLSESWLDFSGPRNAGNLALVGDNFAQNLSINWDRARLINASGATLNIAGNADLTVNSSYLATNATDQIHVGGAVSFKAVPFVFTESTGQVLSERVISIAQPGDVRFGSLQVEDATYLTVHEDDSTLLLGASGNPNDVDVARQITIKSAADIEIEQTASIQSRGVITLEAEGDLVAQRGDKILKAQRLNLRGTTINLDQVEGATVNFNSPGDVSLFAVQDFTLIGSNTGHVVRVTTAGRIATTFGATLDARWLEMRGRSIWLANQTASDRINVNGRANFIATDFVILGLQGAFESKLINVQTDFANIEADRDLIFIGDNSIARSRLRAGGRVVEAP